MADQAAKSATLTIDGGDPIELPVYEASEGPDVIDVGKLTSQGYFTYDPGFVSTASCDSNITYIDGDNGISLKDHGYDFANRFPKRQANWCSCANRHGKAWLAGN